MMKCDSTKGRVTLLLGMSLVKNCAFHIFWPIRNRSYQEHLSASLIPDYRKQRQLGLLRPSTRDADHPEELGPFCCFMQMLLFVLLKNFDL